MQLQPPAWLFCGGKAAGRILQLLCGKAGRLAPNRSSSRSGWQSCGAGCRHCPGAARCCRLLWLQLNNKCIYWDFCYHEGANNPLLDSTPGLPSRPVLAPAATATLAGLGKSLMRSPGGGSAAGLDPAQAGARCPSPHQSQPAAGPSHPALPQAPGPAPQNNPSTPKQPQHLKTAPRRGRLGDVQLFQWLGGMLAPASQPARGVSEGGLDSPFSAN